MEVKNKTDILEKIKFHDRFVSGTGGNFSGAQVVALCPKCNEVGLYQVFSYATAIAKECLQCGSVWLNKDKYSAMTSKHQSIVATAYAEKDVTEVRNIDRGEQNLHSRKWEEDPALKPE